MKNYQFPKLVSLFGSSAPTEHNSVFGITEDDRYLSIPFDPANTDYQAFLKYQAEGGKVYGADEEVPVINTPLPADSTP